MCPLAADISHVQLESALDLSLDLEIPLLVVWSLELDRRGHQVLGRVADRGRSARRIVERRIQDRRRVYKGRISEDILLKDCVQRRVEEDAVPPANRRLAGLERIPRESEPRGEIAVVL